jgi:RsiW-degrading membrane proteinase PrsW (M82 family)
VVATWPAVTAALVLPNNTLMTSETDLSQQPDTLQQQLPINKKQGNSPWKAIFIIVFVAIDAIFVFLIASLIYRFCKRCIGIEMIAGIFLSSPLATIGVIALLAYDFICKPRGKARIIWFAVLILVSW